MKRPALWIAVVIGVVVAAFVGVLATRDQAVEGIARAERRQDAGREADRRLADHDRLSGGGPAALFPHQPFDQLIEEK